MDAVAKLKVLFEADASALDSAVEKSGGVLGKLKGAAGGAMDVLGKIGLAGMGIGVITGAASSAVGAVGDLVGAAEGLGDAAARVGLIWGDEMKGVIEDNATVANSLGMTKTAYLDNVGAIGQFVTNLGVGKDAAADMAMGMTELAPKLAAFADVDTEQAMDALQKGVGGATRGLKEMGIAIPEIPKGLDEAGKAAFIYQQILDQSANAQAAWADNSGDVEVSMQRVSAAVDDAKAALGEKLLPLIAPIAEAFASKLPGAIDALMAIFGPMIDGIIAGAQLIMGVVDTLRAAWEDNFGGIEQSTGDVAGAVTDLLSDLAATFKDVWENKILPAVETFIEWFKANVEPTLKVIFANIQAGLQAFAGWWKANSDTIIGIVSAAWNAISNIFSAAFDLISGIVTAALALLRGDFTGVMEAIRGAVASAIPKIVAAFFSVVEGIAGVIVLLATNIIPAIKTVFVNVIQTIASVLAGAGAVVVGAMTGLIDAIIAGAKSVLGIASPSKVFADIGKAIVDGIKAGIDAAWTAFVGWITRKLGSIIGIANEVFNIGSPSKVFAEIGGWIMAGLAMGIGENEADTVDALARVFQGMTTVIESSQKLMKAVFEFQMPASIDVLRQSFRALWQDAQKLATEAIDVKQWVRGWGGDELELLEPVSGVIGHLANIVEGMAKVSGALAGWKGAPADKIAEMQASVVALTGMAMSVVNVGAVVGLADVAETIKHAAEIASSIAGVDIDKVTRIVAEKLEIVRLNAKDIWEAVANLSAVFRSLPKETREGIVEGFKGFSEAMTAAAAAANAGMFTQDELAKLARITAVNMDIIRLNAKDIWEAVANVSAVFRGLNSETRDAIVEGFKGFADAVGAAVAVVRDVLGIDLPDAMADLDAVDWTRLASIASVVYEAVKAASSAFREAGNKANTELVEGVKLFTDGAGAALKLLADVMNVKETDPGLWQTDWTRLAHVALSALDGVKAASMAFREAGVTANTELVAGVKLFVDGAGAAVKLIGDVMGFKAGEFDPTKTSVDFYRFAEFAKFALLTVKAVGKSFMEMGEEARTNLTAGVSAFTSAAGAAVKLISDVMGFKGGEFDPTKTSVDFYRFAEFAREAVLSVKVAAKSFIGLDEQDRAAITDGVAAFADAVSSALSIVSAVAGLSVTTAALPSQDVLTGIFQWAMDAIASIRTVMGSMTAETAAAVKAGAEAAGAIGDAVGSVVDGIMAALGLGGTGLMGSDPNRKGLGFMQRVRGRRADFLAQQLADTVKRALTAIRDALGGIDVGAPDDPKIKALSQLGDAFSAVAQGLNDIATAKMPNAKQIAALMVALGALSGTGGVAGASGGGGAGGPVTLQLNNPQMVFPAVTASVEVTTNPTIQIGGQTIETLATIIERKLADRFVLGSPSSSGGVTPFNGPSQGKRQGRP